MSAPAPAPGARRFAPGLAAITLLGLAVRAWNLTAQPGLGDDWAAGMSAITFVERGEVSGLMWHHPRLRDLLVYASSMVLGQTKLGVSLPSLVLGVASIAVIGLLAHRLAGPAAGLVAAALTALDPLHVIYSRQAVNDVYMFFFGAAGVLLALLHLSTGRRRHVVLAGVVFGLGLASRWVIAAPLGVTTFWLLVRQGRSSDPAERAGKLALTVASLGVLPVAIYLLTWTPWFAHGRDLSDWVALQRTMWAEMHVHQGFNPATRAFPSRAVLWFLVPVWWADFTSGPAGHVVYLALTNPLAWLPTLPGAWFVARRARRERRPEDVLMLGLFGATWLPLAVASRPIFLNAALAVLPFSLLLVAALVVGVVGEGARARTRLGAYLGVVALSSAPLLALATGAATHLAPFRGIVERFRPERRLEGHGEIVP